MRIRGLGRLQNEYRRMLGRLCPGPTILLYHRVACLPEDPQALAVTPQNFEQHLAVLGQFCEIMSLQELTAFLATGKAPAKAAILTFDDGYADNFTEALPLLEKHAVPATFYLTAGCIGTGREFLQDELERLLLRSVRCPAEVRLRLRGSEHGWAMRAAPARSERDDGEAGWNVLSAGERTPRQRAYCEIHGLLRELSPQAREDALVQLRSQCGEPTAARLAHRALTWEQVKQMVDSKWVEIGAHTVNHAYLSALAPDQLRAEIADAKCMIEERVGCPVKSFAYPYGTRASYTAETVAAVQAAGFTHACSNFRQRVTPATDLFQLPRWVVRNWDGDEFARQLHAARL